MSVIDNNKILTDGAKKTAHSIRFAILGALYPTVDEKYGKRFVLFSNGKQKVYVSNKELVQLAYLSNLKNACDAVGVKAGITALDSDETAARKTYEAIYKSFIQERPNLQDNALDMFIFEEDMKKVARSVSSEQGIPARVEERIAYIKKVVSEFPSLAQEAGLDKVTVGFAMDAVRADINYIEQYREKMATSQFLNDGVEKE